MKYTLIFCSIVCSALSAISAQAQTPPRYTVSADGQEVTDSQTNLIWRRCIEGMNWDGTTCAGADKTTFFTHEEALQHAAILASNTGIAWRLPNANEIFSIAHKTDISPEMFSSAFPATPPTWHWSTSPVVGASNYFVGVGFCDDISGFADTNRSKANQVRLVRTGQ